ncbi:MAG: protein kinase, partial [Selenomonadaceae bacterium]|nr:protein kinase [Selenomonadaceae bacterium]
LPTLYDRIIIVDFGQKGKSTMELWEQYLGSSYEMVDILKDSENGLVALIYDKIGRRVCVLKQRDARSKGIYEMLKEMDNPYVPAIYRLIEQDGKLLVIEEYIDGRTLADILRYDGMLNERTALHILKEICECLRHFHKRNVVHRDIKPSNIILAKNYEVKLIDFGIARVTRPSEESDTEFLGTKGYAPPEQYGFGQTDARSDIYSLGITIRRILGEDYHGSLMPILRKCAALDPDGRYSSVDELLQDVERQQGRKKLQRWILAIVTAFLLAATALHTIQEPKQDRDVDAADAFVMKDAPSPAASPDTVSSPPPQTQQEPSQTIEIPAPAMEEEIPADVSALRTEKAAPLQKWKYPSLNREQCTFSLNGAPCGTGIPVSASVWKGWEREGDMVRIPSDWNMTLHIDNRSASDFVSPVLEITYRGAERQSQTLSAATIPSGGSADFNIPLGDCPVSGKLFWLGVRLRDAKGASFYWEFQFYLE